MKIVIAAFLLFVLQVTADTTPPPIIAIAPPEVYKSKPQPVDGCPLNEEWRHCGTACEPSCAKPFPTICTLQCVIDVCQCKAGFVRGPSGCVKLEQCPSNTNSTSSSTTPVRPRLTCANVRCRGPCDDSLGYPRCLDPPTTRGPIPLITCENAGCPEDCDSSEGYPKCIPAKCGPNAEFTNCGSACEPKCGEPEGERMCAAVCIPNKCQCKQGFVRGPNGCVKREQCPSSDVTSSPPARKCHANEVFNECGSACEPKCGDSDEPMGCPAVCVLNVCQCAPGFVRGPNGCVKKEECPVQSSTPPALQCQANEQLMECGTACEKACGETGVKICSLQCIPNVCQCKPGFVRGPNGCVTEDQCPARTCLANEVFTNCGTACEPSCANPEPTVCTEQCLVDVCQCAKGFVRGPQGCVPREQCPASDVSTTPAAHSCPAREEFKECGTSCEPSCENPNPQVCNFMCVPNVCQCKAGFVRSPKGCVPLRQCLPASVNSCPNNETFKECGSSCEPTCENPAPTICNKMCVPNVCQCQDGLVRGPSGCVPPSQCKGSTKAPTVPRSIYTCANVRCAGVCDDSTGVIRCLPRPVLTCASFDCIPGRYCVQKEGQMPQCVENPNYNPCDGYTCEAGQVCKSVQIQCITVPCLPIARCVTAEKAVKY